MSYRGKSPNRNAQLIELNRRSNTTTTTEENIFTLIPHSFPPDFSKSLTRSFAMYIYPAQPNSI